MIIETGRLRIVIQFINNINLGWRESIMSQNECYVKVCGRSIWLNVKVDLICITQPRENLEYQYSISVSS